MERHGRAGFWKRRKRTHSRWTVKVFIQGKQRVRLQLAKYLAKFLLDPVDGMEEVAAIHA